MFLIPPPPRPTPPRLGSAFLVQQWIHQWGRFLLFVAGFYWIPVRGWANMRAAEAERCVVGAGGAARQGSSAAAARLSYCPPDCACLPMCLPMHVRMLAWLCNCRCASLHANGLTGIAAALPLVSRAVLVFNHPSYVDAAGTHGPLGAASML